MRQLVSATKIYWLKYSSIRYCDLFSVYFFLRHSARPKNPNMGDGACVHCEATIWCALRLLLPFLCTYFVPRLFFCLFDWYAIPHTHTWAQQTINVHFREGWLSILGNALYNICRENGPMRNATFVSCLSAALFNINYMLLHHHHHRRHTL